MNRPPIKKVLLMLMVSCLAVSGQVMLPHRHSLISVRDTNYYSQLVGYWPLDETSGLRYDYSGFHHDLSPSNALTFSTAQLSNSVSFPATSNSFLNIASNPNLLFGTNSFGVSTWVYLNSTNADMGIFTKDNPTTSDRDFRVWYNKTTGTYCFSAWDTDGTIHTVSATTHPVYTNLWMNILAYWNTNSGGVAIRMNGIEGAWLGTGGKYILTESPADLRIGACADDSLDLDGKVDQTRLWNTINTDIHHTNTFLPIFFGDQFHIANNTEREIKRNRVLTNIFGAGGLPDEVGTLVATNSPVVVTNYASCSYIDMVTYSSRPRLWVANGSNGDVMLLHQGHSQDYNGYQYAIALQTFLNASVNVCGLVMPGGDEVTSGTSTSHNTGTNALETFVGPVVIAINTLADNGYTNFYMAGLSGGGWTTVLAASVDTRISKSFPIAGSLPLYYPTVRDWEQLIIDRNFLESYLELYVLASTPSRRMDQIHYLNDDCCFSHNDFLYGADYTSYVAGKAAGLGSGSYSMVWEVYTTHQFESNVITAEILPEITTLAPPDNTLLLSYPFNEGAGTNITDASGLGNHGWMAGSSKWISGKAGYALQCGDGIADFARTTASLNLGTNIVTVCSWLSWSRFSTTAAEVWELSPTTSGNDDTFNLVPNSTLGVFATIQSGGNRREIVPDWAAQSWTHCAVIYDNTTNPGDIKCYINGIEQTLGLNSNLKTTHANFRNDVFYLFSRAGTSQFGSGGMDDLRIYGGELTGDEIRYVMKHPQ